MSERKELEVKRDFEKAEEHWILEGLEETLKSYAGRKFLWWALTISGYGGIPWRPDPHTSSFLAGQFNVGQQLLDKITEVGPEHFLTMQKELQDERREREQRERNARGDDDGDPDDPSGHYTGIGVED